MPLKRGFRAKKRGHSGVSSSKLRLGSKAALSSSQNIAGSRRNFGAHTGLGVTIEEEGYSNQSSAVSMMSKVDSQASYASRKNTSPNSKRNDTKESQANNENGDNML